MLIGILTFHRAHNYGAVLQCYCLKVYLGSLGHEVHVLDYRPDYLTRLYSLRPYGLWLKAGWKYALKCFLKEPFLYRKRKERYMGFETFIRCRIAPAPFHDRMDEYDLVFLGSDQIWNPVATGGKPDPVYWGDRCASPVASYAASYGRSSIEEKHKDFIRSRLDKLAGISVREESFRQLLTRLTGKEISTVLDPMLLAGKNTLDKIAVPPGIDEPYVLVYDLFNDKMVIRLAKGLAKQVGGKMIDLRHGKEAASSPEEFVGFFKDAACVVTSSFHGTAMSILYGKPFYTIKQGNDKDLRQGALLESLDLADRMIDGSSVPRLSTPDYSLANKNLHALRTLSIRYVDQCVRSILP